MRYGLRPNLTKGKTEILLCIRGKNSVKTRKTLFEQSSPTLFIPSRTIPDCHISVITRYVHLGSQVTIAATDQPAMTNRFGQARSVFDRFRKKIFQSGDVSLETRTQLFEPFILSILQFGMGTWISLRPADNATASRKLILMYKGLLKPLFDRDAILTMSHDEVIARVQLPPFAVLLHINRLRQFGQILHAAPPILWALIEHEVSWLEECRLSFTWLYQQLCTTIVLPDPLCDWQPWETLILHETGRWKGLLKRAQKHATHQIGIQWATRHWHATIMELAADTGISAPWRTKITAPQKPFHVCPPCQKRFANRAAWSVHMFKKHQRIGFLRKFANDGVCRRCSKQYWTPSRLVQHLQYNTECANYMIRHAPVELPEPGRNSRKAKALVTPALCPPVDTAVEVLDIDRPSLCDPEKEPDQELLADFVDLLQVDLLLDPDFDAVGPLMSIVADFRTVMCKYPLHFDQIHMTWDTFLCDWKTLFDEHTQQRVIEKWQSIFDVINVALTPAWLVPPSHVTEAVDNREAAWEWLQNNGHDLTSIPFLRPRVPRPCRERYAVHIFSGRRRPGDLQQALEELPAPDAMVLHVLSLDVIFGEDGDLLSRKARGKWFHLFMQRAILAFYAGPPCESWSAARFVELANSRTRPIRSSLLPWGLHVLSLRELAQTAVANALMFFVLMLMVIQASHGLFGCMEHPAPPKEDFKPSIWRTWLWQFLMHLGIGCQLIRQGYFGSPSSKPTTFAFTIPLTDVAQTFREHQIRDDLPQQVTIGKNADGSFATAALKEYPPALCRALSAVFHKWTMKLPSATSSVDPQICQFLESFEAAMDAQMGPDFNPPKTRLIHFA